MRKSFSEILMPAISRRNAFTGRGRDACARCRIGVAILEHALARHGLQDADRAHELRRVAFLAHGLAALGLEGQHDAVVFQRDVGLQKRGGAAGAVEPRIGFIAGTDRGACDQLDHGRQRELPRRLVAGEMHGDVAPDLRKRRDEPGQAMRLALLAHLFPIGVIAVLQPAGGVDADRLQMRIGVGRIAHLAIGRRHRHPVQPADGADMLDAGAVGANEAE